MIDLEDISAIFEDEIPPYRGDYNSDNRSIKNHERYRVLTQLMDKTFGRSSTIDSPKYAVTMTQVADDRVLVKYHAIVMFRCERTNYLLGRGAGIVDKFTVSDVVEAEKKYTHEAIIHVKHELQQLNSQFKAVVGEDQDLNFEMVTYDTSMQIMPTGIHNPRKTSHFYLQAVIHIKDTKETVE